MPDYLPDKLSMFMLNIMSIVYPSFPRFWVFGIITYEAYSFNDLTLVSVRISQTINQE